MSQTIEELIEEFSEQVRQYPLTGTTEVNLLYFWMDQNGVTYPPRRSSLVPHTTVAGFDSNMDAAIVFHKGAIIDNIRSLLSSAPTDFSLPKGGLQIPMKIVRFELEFQEI